MIRSQRKRHWVTWVIIAVLLPTGMILAFQVVPEKPLEGNIPVPEKVAQVHSAFVGSHFEARCQNRANQLEVEVKILQPLESPASNLYWKMGGEDAPGTFLGALRTTGTYRFVLPPGTDPAKVQHLTVYDVLQNKAIQTLDLKP